MSSLPAQAENPLHDLWQFDDGSLQFTEETDEGPQPGTYVFFGDDSPETGGQNGYTESEVTGNQQPNPVHDLWPYDDTSIDFTERGNTASSDDGSQAGADASLHDLWEYDDDSLESIDRLESRPTYEDGYNRRFSSRNAVPRHMPAHVRYRAQRSGYYNTPRQYHPKSSLDAIRRMLLAPESYDGLPAEVLAEIEEERSNIFVGLFGVHSVDPSLASGSTGSSTGPASVGTPSGGVTLFTCPTGTSLAGQLISNLALC
eukprot:s1_g992.t1